jgi:hypothetical protein
LKLDSGKIHKPPDAGKPAQGGEYYAAGVGGSAITGRGADLLIIDDPHSEQDAMNYSCYWNEHMNGIHPVHDSVCNQAVAIVCGHDTMEYQRSNRHAYAKHRKKLKADQWDTHRVPGYHAKW